ncbi:hypothetical protein PQR14_36475 [Paraburkholderia bryophila]|uniref:hypothetical protein n=1 Tax=Paraburkholderia bryophila TaxID=420952 RepID=UPI0038BD2418
MADDQSKEDQDNAAAIPDMDSGSLTAVEVPLDPRTAPLPLQRPALRDYDPRPDHDKARRRIAYWLLALLTILLVATVVGTGAFFFLKPPTSTFDQFKSIVELILTPLLTLVSAATGFYFGSQEKS